MKRNTILGGIVLIVVVGGLIWYGATRPAVNLGGGPGQTSTSTVPATSPYTEHGQYYDIAANYPTTTPMTGAKNEAALSQMRGFISDQVASFKQQGNFDALTQEDIRMMGYDQGRKQALQIKYLRSTSPESSPRTVTYIYTIYLDTLGAHGNTFFRTFTYDLQTGQELSIGDLFAPGADYLPKLSSLSRSYLTQNLGQFADAKMINDGTKPDAQSFQNFFLDNGTLSILFAPYDVAAYAAGPQTVRIPVSDLSDILKPAYR